MSVVKISIDEYPQLIGDVSERMKELGNKALYRAALRMVNVIITETIPAAYPQPVARGIYRAGWRAEKTDEGAEYLNDVRHAGAVERGVKAAAIKVGRDLIDSLTEWVQIRGLGAGRPPRSVAFGVASKMAANVTIRRGDKTVSYPGGGAGRSASHIMEEANKQLERVIDEEVRATMEEAWGSR